MEAPLAWRPIGGTESLRIATKSQARIERSKGSFQEDIPYDPETYPHILHLKNGERIPCQITAYNETTLDFQSPFLTSSQIPSKHVKAIEIRSDPNIDSTKLKRALTVPRFNRKSPPSHLLVAKNGDLKRGELLAINGNTVQFESKLRKMTLPIGRSAQVVCVFTPVQDKAKGNIDPKPPERPVRAKLADGSTLMFERSPKMACCQAIPQSMVKQRSP